MAEGEVHDAVGLLGARPQNLDVLDVAAQDLGAGAGDVLGGGVRAGQAEDLVSLGKEFGDNGRPDPTGRAGDEYAHDENLLGAGVPSAGVAAPVMSVAVISLAHDVSDCHGC